ncbi:MAG: tetraacyldisaccharide 4'-kinase [Acidobacteria bacterium]|nr:MAG: tetraacyldisaccharide 4'-kinase [Acidobacteriota bacterium]
MLPLQIISYLYAFGVHLRLMLYGKNILRSHSLGKPTIAIGNLTAGGTGKTPLTIFIAKELAKRRLKICILTRGYGRKEPQNMLLVSSEGKIMLYDVESSGDEPLEMAERLKGDSNVSIIADANRIRAARWAIEKLNPDVFILDDAFQHLQVKRDVNLLLIDSTNPFGNMQLLPAGILREPLSSITRADAVLLTKENLSSQEKLDSLKNMIKDIHPTAKVFSAKIYPLDVVHLNNKIEAIDEIKANKTLAFCAIANPDAFFQLLKAENFKICATKVFPDHYRYSQEDVSRIETLAMQKGANLLITTPKDAVKLRKLNFSLPCTVLMTELKPDEEFLNWLLHKLNL